MDSRPFLEFSVLDLNEDITDQLKKFAKESFDLEEILSSASELKYTKGIKRSLLEEWTNPSDDFVKMFASRVFDGRLTKNTKDQFTDVVRKAFHAFVNDRISERLKLALSKDETQEDSSNLADKNEKSDTEGLIVTTDEELDGFYIVKSIVREVVDAHRVYVRDTQSYCGVLLDDNNRKPICRLHFNAAQKYVGTFDLEKKETRQPIDDVNDIYKFADVIKATANAYVS